jgi:DNA-binding transcriptional regulator YhcF (GntR family)
LPTVQAYLYYLYYSEMRETLEAWLRSHSKEVGALPSIRELARHHGVAPLTVHRALRRLANEGLVHALDRKGYFWGLRKSPDTHPVESPDERFSARFLADLGQGAYHPWKELPPRKALGQVYGIDTKRVGRVLAQLSERGILEMRGRRVFPAASIHKNPGASVIVIVRCDVGGEFLMDTEREIDFIKSVRRELAERDLGMIRVGYSEQAGGRFLDRLGREIHLAKLPDPLLGVVLSTWLLQDPLALLRRLEKLGLPLSVWWEHPAAVFPKRRFRAGLAGFNLSFGASAGIAVGKHLASRGHLHVTFISPFHNNDWSPARVRGLREALLPWGGTVHEWVDPSVISAWHLERSTGNLSAMRRHLEKTLLRFLEDKRLAAIPTWVMANDLTAGTMHRLLRKRGGPSPRMIGFDNTSESERLGFDSFEFHTDGMVRQMLHHITHPKAELFTGEPLREMIGRIVLRS